MLQRKRIENEVHFQIRKMGIINFEINNPVQDAKKLTNQLLGINDDSLVKLGQSQMFEVRFKI